MARSRSRGADGAPSLMGEFRQIFLDNPKFLKARTNDQVAQMWLAKHPEYTELPKNAKSSMANVKSVLRSKKRRKKKAKAGDNSEVMASPKVKTNSLVSLETQIDDCLIFAKNLGNAKLADVIKHLHSARNRVVWMLGA